MLAIRSSAVGIAVVAMLAIAVAMVNAAAANTNMNGEYTIANPGLKAFARTSNMSHYAGGGSPVEYFDVCACPPIDGTSAPCVRSSDFPVRRLAPDPLALRPDLLDDDGRRAAAQGDRRAVRRQDDGHHGRAFPPRAPT